MSQKLKLLRTTLEDMKEGKSHLKVVRLQGVFNALLIKKHFENSEIVFLEVETLDNANPQYGKGNIELISLSDGGIIELKLLTKEDE